MSTSASTDKLIDVTKEVTRSFDRYYDPSNKRDLRRRAASEGGYGAFDLAMCAGWVSDFKDIFDFYVNLPGTKKPEKPLVYSWRPLERNMTIDKFLEFRADPMRTLLELAKGTERIQVGYVLADERGRLDSFTTWSRCKWLLATERSIVYIDSYDTTLH